MLRTRIAKRLGASSEPKDRTTNDKFYWSAPWMKFRAMLLNRNPICQRLHNGEQCHRPSVIGHHIISPIDNMALAFVTSNVVMLCRSCHPDTQGTPSWVLGVDYVKTIGYGDTL